MSGDVKANSMLCNASAAPLAGIGNSIGNLVSQLKNCDSSGLTGAQTALPGIEGKAASTGNTTTEDPNVANS